MITLKPIHFKKSGRIVLTDSWISNGHWALRKVQAQNHALLAAPELVAGIFNQPTVTIEDSKVEATIPEAKTPYKPLPLVATVVDKGKKKQVRLYRGVERYIGIDETFVQLLQAEGTILYGSPNTLGPVADNVENNKVNFIICPIRIETVTKDLAPIEVETQA